MISPLNFIGTKAGCAGGGLIAVKRHPLANDVGVDAVSDGNAGKSGAGLKAFVDDLGFEQFGVRTTLAYGNPDDKSDCVRLRGHNRPYRPGSQGVFAGPLP